MRVGIVGYGSFGKLLAGLLSKQFNVLVYDQNKNIDERANVKSVDFDTVSQSDVIVLAVNLDSLEDVCSRLAKTVDSSALVIEVCSSKIKPVKILKKYLEDKCQYMSTHPLFGPQSINNQSARKIVICESKVQDKNAINNFLKTYLNLQIIEMTAEEHDRQMAWVHALTFFVGRGLKELDLVKSELKTDYYQKLLDLVELENQHSIELFNTVQKGNPYSKEVREQFVQKLLDINKRLEEVK